MERRGKDDDQGWDSEVEEGRSLEGFFRNPCRRKGDSEAEEGWLVEGWLECSFRHPCRRSTRLPVVSHIGIGANAGFPRQPVVGHRSTFCERISTAFPGQRMKFLRRGEPVEKGRCVPSLLANREPTEGQYKATRVK